MKCLKLFHIFLLHIQSFYEPKLSVLLHREIFSAMLAGRTTSQNDSHLKSNKTWLLRGWEDRALGIFPSALFGRKIAHNPLRNHQWVIKYFCVNVIKQCHSTTPSPNDTHFKKQQHEVSVVGKMRKKTRSYVKLLLEKSKGLEKKKKPQQQILIQTLCLNAFSVAGKCLYLFALLSLPVWLTQIWMQVVSVWKKLITKPGLFKTILFIQQKGKSHVSLYRKETELSDTRTSCFYLWTRAGHKTCLL